MKYEKVTICGVLALLHPRCQLTRLLEGQTCHSATLLLPADFFHCLQGVNLEGVVPAVTTAQLHAN